MRTANMALFPMILLALLASPGNSLVMTAKTGTWPKDWPKALEALRKSSVTIDVATGIQQKIYEIHFSDRDTFERVWPILLKLKTPEAPLTLYRANTDPPAAWGTFLSNQLPAVRVYASSGGYSVNPELDPVETRTNFKKVLDDGQALHASPPWPDYLKGKNGELPEFVTMVVRGKELRWIPAKPGDGGMRARVDLDLVVDGKVIDLNRIRLPSHTPMNDRRFTR